MRQAWLDKERESEGGDDRDRGSKVTQHQETQWNRPIPELIRHASGKESCDWMSRLT